MVYYNAELQKQNFRDACRSTLVVSTSQTLGRMFTQVFFEPLATGRQNHQRGRFDESEKINRNRSEAEFAQNFSHWIIYFTVCGSNLGSML